MGNNHLKRLAAPRTWEIKRKEAKFVVKPVPGRNLQLSLPLGLILKDMLNLANTARECRKILNSNEVKIDGKPRKDPRFPVGIFDVIEFANTNECYRVILNDKGKLAVVKIEKCDELKPSKIIGKTAIKGKLQLNLYDGNNILVTDGKYKVGDTILLSLKDKKILNHIKLDKNAKIFLIGGKHIGDTGQVEDIIENKITYKDKKGNLVETLKEYAFVIDER